MHMTLTLTVKASKPGIIPAAVAPTVSTVGLFVMSDLLAGSWSPDWKPLEALGSVCWKAWLSQS